MMLTSLSVLIGATLAPEMSLSTTTISDGDSLRTLRIAVWIFMYKVFGQVSRLVDSRDKNLICRWCSAVPSPGAFPSL